LSLVFVGAGRSLREQALPVLFRIGAAKGAAQEVPVVVGQTLKVLAATRARQAGVAVPAAAVVRNAANETVVWVHESAERFVARRVRTAPLDAGRMLVAEGLVGTERVVTDGAMALSQIR
ncbi:MAG: HlyD family secretion protein, partial [Sulfuritalea sp.]|nr:HlyD family secretion protein [Sulfuritalea sp.]